MTPIWKDTEYNFTTDKFTYTIEKDGETIYTGKSYRFPDSDSGSVRVNKIVQNYLYTEFPSTTGTTTHSGMTGTFLVKNSSGTTVGTYEFINDWNYDDSSYAANTNLNIPINNHTAPNMYVFTTDYKKSGKKVQTTVQRANNPAFCGKYAIYYTNRKNGWDGFLIEGKVLEKDTYKQYDYESPINTNRMDREREKTRYRNFITQDWELSTLYLTDTQSRVLARHLLSSNNVVLHNLETDTLIPVIITDEEAEYKTFKDEKKLVSYTIRVKAANKEELC